MKFFGSLPLLPLAC